MARVGLGLFGVIFESLILPYYECEALSQLHYRSEAH